MTPAIRTWAFLVVALVLLAAGIPGGPDGNSLAVAGEVRTILVLSSHSAAPYKEALAGFEESIRQRGLEVRIEAHDLEGNAAKVVALLQDESRSRGQIVLSLGNLATQAAIQVRSDMPLVAGLILTTAALKGATNAAAVTLEYPAETQFQWLKRLLPQVRTLGVLYNPPENRQRILAAAKVAQGMGYDFEAQEVPAPRDLPAAMESVGRRADVLWGVQDSVVLNQETSKQVLLFSFRNRIPFVGPSAAWVKAGALYALDWDYRDVGMQCADMAARILQGAAPASIPATGPRKAAYALNQRTAQHMKVDIPEALVRGAREVY